MRPAHLLTTLLFCTLCAHTASAHENLIAPPLRDGTDQKVRPCGGAAWGSHVTALKPGATVLMQWVETIHHPGWFRISFRASESGDFNDHILVAKVNSMTGINDYSKSVTLPNMTAQQASLQLSFVMTDQPNNTMPYGYNEYSNCTDIILTNNPNAVASPEPSATPTPTSTTTGTPDPEASPSPKPSSGTGEDTSNAEPGVDASSPGGGCSTGAGGVLAWALCALALRRRRPPGN